MYVYTYICKYMCIYMYICVCMFLSPNACSQSGLVLLRLTFGGLSLMESLPAIPVVFAGAEPRELRFREQPTELHLVAGKWAEVGAYIYTHTERSFYLSIFLSIYLYLYVYVCMYMCLYV